MCGCVLILPALSASLNRVRKSLVSFGEAQKVIDAEKAQFDELKQQKKDPEMQALNDKYESIKQQLDELKAEQDAA